MPTSPGLPEPTKMQTEPTAAGPWPWTAWTDWESPRRSAEAAARAAVGAARPFYPSSEAST